MERELMLSGIGGQGVQLSAQIIARAATLEQRHVMLFGVYGGTMRGGSTESTVVVSRETISAPPIVSRTWSAMVMHHAYWQPLQQKLRPQAVVLLNSSLFEGEIDRAAYRVFDVPATRHAAELGNAMAATMVLTGAYAGLTGLVSLDALIAAMRDSVPAYRQQHVALNERALRTGYEAVPHHAAPAWNGGGG